MGWGWKEGVCNEMETRKKMEEDKGDGGVRTRLEQKVTLKSVLSFIDVSGSF